MEKELLKALLGHAKYSFTDIEWNFERLTRREKSLIKNQGVLDRIRQLAGAEEKRNGDG